MEYGALGVPTRLPSTLNCSADIVALPLAVAAAVIVIVFETVLPFAGLVMLTVGGGITLLTMIVMLALAVLPKLSRATAVRVWLPLVKFAVFRAMV